MFIFHILLPSMMNAANPAIVEPYFVGQLTLSYGKFNSYLMKDAEMEEAVENCDKLHGRLPRFNTLDDYNKFGDLSVRYGEGRGLHTWTAYVDGTITGDIEEDGQQMWYDYYDGDLIGKA